MNFSFSELEQLLCDSISGDNNRIQNAYQSFEKASLDKESLIRSFILVIQNSTNETARNAAIIVLADIVQSNWSTLNENLQNEIYELIFSIQDNIHESNLHIFLSLAFTVHNLFYQDPEKRLRTLSLFNFHNKSNTTGYLQLNTGVKEIDGKIQISKISLDDKPEDFTEEQFKRRQLKVHFTIELLCSFNGDTGINEISRNLEASIQCVMIALNDENIYYQCLGIKAISILIGLYPSQIDQLHPHILRMVEIAKDSLQMQDMDFQMVWKSFADFFNIQPSECVNRVSFLMNDFLTIIFAAANRTDILPENRMCPLFSFRKNLEYFEPEVLNRVAYTSIEIAVANVRSLHQLSYPYIFYYDNCFNMFSHAKVYGLSIKILNDLINSDEYCRKITALCLIKVLIIHLPHQVYIDINLFTKLTEEALKQDDVLYLEAGCQIVSSFPYYFTWNLVDPYLFLPLISPLLVHESPDVREAAYVAVENIFCISFINSFSCSSVILQQKPKVIEIDNYRFLRLLSISIKKHGYFEPEEANLIEQIALPLLSSDDPGTICGGLQIAVQLMHICEESRSALFDKSKEIIEKLILDFDDPQFIYLGIHELISIFKMLNNEKQKIFKLRSKIMSNSYSLLNDENSPSEGQTEYLNYVISKYSEKILFMLNLDSKDNALLKTMVLPKIAYLDSITNNHPFQDALLAVAMPFIEMQWANYVIAALKVLMRITPKMTKENAFAAFNAVGTACVKTKEVLVACVAYKVMGHIVRLSSPEIREVVLPTAHHMCTLYVKGELSVLEGVPPLTNDFDVNLMYSSMQLFISLFFEKTEAQQYVLKELFSIYLEHKNLLTNEMILYVFSRALACDICVPEDSQRLFQLTMALLVEDQHFVLMMSTSNLVYVFVNKNCLDWEKLCPILPILVHWWARMKSERHKLRSTFSILALTFWEIAYHFKIIDKLLDIYPNQSNSQIPESSQNNNEPQLSLFEETFEQFPPDNLSRLEMMSKLLICFFNDDQCKEIIMAHDNLFKVIASSICKFLIRPKIELTTRGVTQEMINSIHDILLFIKNNKPEVKKVIVEFIGDIQSRNLILEEFIS